ncbi:hypothetical protein FJ471_07690 [Mesorhizobium sp. B2-7-1]|nr:hypothetical protein FJ471_07690 [Mesorhizobium sp. B2-7-1]
MRHQSLSQDCPLYPCLSFGVHSMPTAYCLLPTAYCLLPDALCATPPAPPQPPGGRTVRNRLGR